MFWRCTGVVLAGSCGFVAFGFWAFGMDLSAVGWLMIGAAAIPLRWTPGRWLALALAALVAPALMVGSVYEYGHRVEVLSARLDRGPSAYSARDKLGIYGLNLAMGAVGALVGFPEVAMETLLLTVPGPRERTFASDFPMRSPKVRTAARAMLGDPRPRTVVWSYEPSESARVALACNALHLVGEPVRQGSRRGVEIRGTVEISYADRYFLEMAHFPGRTIGVEEGLFRMLEVAGWLHPYDAVWIWTVWEESALDAESGERTADRSSLR